MVLGPEGNLTMVWEGYSEQKSAGKILSAQEQGCGVGKFFRIPTPTPTVLKNRLRLPTPTPAVLKNRLRLQHF